MPKFVRIVLLVSHLKIKTTKLKENMKKILDKTYTGRSSTNQTDGDVSKLEYMRLN